MGWLPCLADWMGKSVGNGSTLEVRSLVSMSVLVFFPEFTPFLACGHWVWFMSNACGN